MNTVEGHAFSRSTINTSKSRRPLGSRSQNIQSAVSGKNKNTTRSESKLPSRKPPRGDFSKVSSSTTSTCSENIQEWTEKRNCDDDETTKVVSFDDTSDELCREDDASSFVFREIADYDDPEDIMVLKRANPVYDSDDEDYMAAAAKRQRTTTSSSMVLSWHSQVSSDPSGDFSIRLQKH
ncbi:hypothetical protein IV203_005968 [Nitzschia inconspicua]|uniref:Uncharacterized protein n=1 Tax=Nitzschia inconspicua TaxID=303405 RepID=A0A9K3KPC0_9STRA|nr:hypothetical protein IV203_005968 [Nitzschia inconspicua]